MKMRFLTKLINFFNDKIIKNVGFIKSIYHTQQKKLYSNEDLLV